MDPKELNTFGLVASAGFRPSALPDLLFAEFASMEATELVEREQMEAVLGERELEIHQGDSARMFGKLVGADALVLLSTVNIGDRPGVEVTLLDSRQGIPI